MALSKAPTPQRPDDAVAFLRAQLKGKMSDEAIDKLIADAVKSAKVTARASLLRLANDAWAKIVEAEKKALPFEDARLVNERAIRDAYIGTATKPASRLDAAVKTVTAQSLGKGRHEMVTVAMASGGGGDSINAYTHQRFDAVMDDRVSDICEECNGTIRPIDDPWWRTHTPPLHHNCFPAGTPVTTPTGAASIESLAVGDMVLTHTGQWRPVVELHRSPSPEALVEVELASGRKVLGTGGHPALTVRGWIELSSLNEGDFLLYAAPSSEVDHGVHHGDDGTPGADEAANALDWDTLRALGHLDGQAKRSDVDVTEHQGAVHNEGLLKLACVPTAGEPVKHQAFGAGRLGDGIGVRVGVGEVLCNACTHGALGDACVRQSTGGNKLVGDSSETGVGVFGVTLGPVSSARSTVFHDGAHALALPSGASLSVLPLGGNSLASAPNTDAVGESQCLLVSDARHASSFSVHRDMVVAVRTVKSAVDVVFNIGVEHDESYVASGYVVHNCRSIVTPLTASEAASMGVTVAPKVAVPDGFGTTTSAYAWSPDPDDYPQQIAAIYKQKFGDAA